MIFKIAAWNMRRNSGGWAFLAETLQPDVALLQEAPTPPQELLNIYKGPIGTTRQWGSAVVSFDRDIEDLPTIKNRHSSDPFELYQHHPGAMAVARVSLPESEPLVAVSLYGLLAGNYAQSSVLRLLADLLPLFDSPLKDRVVLGGDLNLSTQLKKPDRQRHQAIFAYMESLGLRNCFFETRESRKSWVDCPCEEAPHCYHVQTHRHVSNKDPQNDRKWHNDYLFISDKLVRRLVDCYALNEESAGTWAISDHCPIVAVLDL